MGLASWKSKICFANLHAFKFSSTFRKDACCQWMRLVFWHKKRLLYSFVVFQVYLNLSLSCTTLMHRIGLISESTTASKFVHQKYPFFSKTFPCFIAAMFDFLFQATSWTSASSAWRVSLTVRPGILGVFFGRQIPQWKQPKATIEIKQKLKSNLLFHAIHW